MEKQNSEQQSENSQGSKFLDQSQILDSLQKNLNFSKSLLSEEKVLISAIVKSQILLFFIGLLVFYLFNLMSEYITVFFFAFIFQITLRQFKDNMVQSLVGFFADKNSKVSQSKLSVLVQKVIFFIRRPKNLKKEGFSLFNSFQITDLTTNLNFLVSICVVYGIFTRLGLSGLVIFGIIIFAADFMFRAGFDFFNNLLEKVGGLQKFRKVFTSVEFMDPIATNLVILLFLFGIIFLTFSLVGLFGFEIYQIQLKTSEIIQDINYSLNKLGLDQYLDQNYIKTLINEHIEKLDEYIDQSQFNMPVTMIKSISKDLLGDGETNENQEFQNQNQIAIEQGIQDCQQQYLEYLEYGWIPGGIQQIMSKGLYSFCYLNSYFVEFDFNISEVSQNLVNQVKDSSIQIASAMQATLATIFVQIFSFLMIAVDYVLQFFVFIISLNYLLQSKTFQEDGLIRNLLSSFPGNSKNLYSFLMKNIKGVLVCTLEIGLFHLFFTWLVLDIFGCQFTYLTSIFAGLIAIVPVVPAFLVVIPHVLYLYIEGFYIWSIMLFLVYFYISGRSFDDIYSGRINGHPYLVGIAVGFGIYSFGIRGIIYGPLMICLGQGLFMLFSESAEKSGVGKGSGKKKKGGVKSEIKKILKEKKEKDNKELIEQMQNEHLTLVVFIFIISAVTNQFF